MKILFAAALAIIVVVFAATLASAKLGIDISSPLGSSALSCARNSGISIYIARGYRSYGAVDPNIGTMISEGRTAGLDVATYLFPCRSKNVNDMVNDLHGAVGDIPVWLDIESNPSPGCSWGSPSQSNCQFLSELISACKSKFSFCGVYSSEYEWSITVGSGCRAGADAGVDLWYAGYDGSQSFDDFRPFGGWNSPVLHQFADSCSVCGIGGSADFNWAPGGSPPSPPGPAPPGPSPSGGCSVFWAGLCPGGDNCMCTTGAACSGNSKECATKIANMTAPRNKLGGCAGRCMNVEHGTCPGSSQCLRGVSDC